MMTSEQTSTPQPQPPQVTVSAQYVKDFSFESPNAPNIFSALGEQPEMSMGVNLGTKAIAPNSYEVVLSLKLDAKIQGRTAFIAEMVYGGVFNLPAAPEEQLRMFLMVEAPRLLFPFARTIMMDAIRDGGFPNVIINPIDFLGLYVANQGNIGTMPAAGVA